MVCPHKIPPCVLSGMQITKLNAGANGPSFHQNKWKSNSVGKGGVCFRSGTDILQTSPYFRSAWKSQNKTQFSERPIGYPWQPKSTFSLWHFCCVHNPQHHHFWAGYEWVCEFVWWTGCRSHEPMAKPKQSLELKKPDGFHWLTLGLVVWINSPAPIGFIIVSKRSDSQHTHRLIHKIVCSSESFCGVKKT